MKRIIWAVSALVLLGIYLTACGASNSSTSTPTSGLTKRVLASNSFSGRVEIADALLDRLSTFFILVASQPTQMRLTPDRSLTLVFNQTGNQIAVINNSTETIVGSISLPDHSDGFVALDSTKGFAAVRNASVVEALDLTNVKIAQTVNVATPIQIALGNTGKQLLVFSDTLPGTITVVDAQKAFTDPTNASTQVNSAFFDHPIFGVFAAGDGSAYVLSCGPECGGTQAMVTKVDMTTSPPTVVSAVNVPAATMALLDTATLYVAGTNGGGQLSVVDTGAMTASAPVAIGDGFHWKMALDTHGHLYVGAKTCTQLRCLSIYDTGAHTATVEQDANGNGFGDFTGVQLISGRDRIYLAQGGEIRIFDTTTATPIPQPQQIDTVGKTEDVLLIDQ